MNPFRPRARSGSLAAAIGTVLACVALAAVPGLARAEVKILIGVTDTKHAGVLETLRKKLAVRSDRALPTIGARLWTSSLGEAEAQRILREATETPAQAGKAPGEEQPKVAWEIVSGDYREFIQPVNPKLVLPQAVQANLKGIEARGYAKRIAIVKIRSDAFAAAYLSRGFDRENGILTAGSTVWNLFPNESRERPGVKIVATRVGRSVHDAEGRRFAWVGEVNFPAKKPFPARYQRGFIAASYADGNLHARIERHGAIYQLIPLGQSYHAAVEVRPRDVPEDQYDKVGAGDAGGEQLDKFRGGECSVDLWDKVGAGDAGGEQLDKLVVGDAGGEQLDKIGAGDAGGEQLDRIVGGDAGGEQLDRLGFCPGACVPVATVRGEACDEGPKPCGEIRVGVAFTREGLGELPATAPGAADADAERFARYLLDVTAASFARSGIHTRLRLAGVKVFDGLERGDRNASALRAAIDTPAPGSRHAEVRKWRDAVGADVVMLLSAADRAPDGSLVGGVSPALANTLKPEHAYSVVVARYADAQLSFQHELGHLLGAGHDTDAGTARLFASGQGKRHQCKWRSTMAYGDDRNCREGVPRYAMWTSCNLYFGDEPVGGPLQNNARVINRTSSRVGGFRP